MLDLSRVTLIGITTRDYPELADALERCEAKAKFGNVVVFTDWPHGFPGRECVPIPPMQGSPDVSIHNLTSMVAERHRYRDFTLNVHADSWIVNPAAWSDEFYGYDYIGARWTSPLVGNAVGHVGNDGFGWKSRRFWDALASIPFEKTRAACHPADVAMCLDEWDGKPGAKGYRTYLESLGLQWAPADVADRFSVEDRSYNGAFGFHGRAVMREMMRIPKIIHQTWKNEDIPHHIYPAEWVESWKRPGWAYHLCTDAEIEQQLASHVPEALTQWDTMPGVVKGQFGRFLSLYEMGGVYCDLDYQCFRDLSPLIENRSLLLSWHDRRGRVLTDAIMGSYPGNPLFLRAAREAWARWKRGVGSIEKMTSFEMLTDIFPDHLRHCVMPSLYLVPVEWTHPMRMAIHGGAITYESLSVLQEKLRANPECYAATYWTHNWEAKRS